MSYPYTNTKTGDPVKYEYLGGAGDIIDGVGFWAAGETIHYCE